MGKRLNGMVFRTFIKVDEAVDVDGVKVHPKHAVARAQRETKEKNEFLFPVDDRGEKHAMAEAVRQAEEWIGWVEVPEEKR